jgi:drug/metabolite transporter (DMT)-like permease
MGYVFVSGYIVLVGVATFLMKTSLKSLSPYQLHFLISIGMFVIGIPAILIAHKTLKLPAKDVPAGLLIGVFFAAGSLLFTLSLSKMSASIASVLAACYVAVVVVLSALFLKEKFDLIKGLGLTLTFAGVLLLTYRS